MDEHLIEDGLWQRVLEGLRQEPHMHTHDLDGLRRFVSACFVVLRRNCTWAELGCFVPSAAAAKKRFPSQSAALRVAGPSGASGSA